MANTTWQTTERFWIRAKLVGHDGDVWLSFDTPREIVQRLKSIAKSRSSRLPKVERILAVQCQSESFRVSA